MNTMHATNILNTLIPRWGKIIRIVLAAFLALASGSAQSGEIVTYILTDHLGSPVIEMNGAGQVIKREVYGPYGQAQISPNNSGIGYTGHMQDGDTGLTYMQARYFDPEAIRFLSPDPVRFSPGQPNHFNPYWYAEGNPYLYTDPTGLCPEGASVTKCVEANNVENSANKTVESNTVMDAALIATKSNVESNINNGDTVEKLGYLVGNEESGYEFTAEQSPNTSSDRNKDAVSGVLPEGAAAITHGHIDGKTDGFLSLPGGDPLNLRNVGVPVGTVSQGRVGVWELKGGKLQFRVISGRMSRKEARKMQGVVNKAQESLFNNTESGN